MSPSKIFSAPTHFSLQIFLNFLKLSFVILPSTIWNYTVLSLDHLKCAFELLLYNQYSLSSAPNINNYYCSFSNIPNKPGSEEFIRIARFKSKEGSDDENNADNQCAVCLCEVKEGDEIGELRCCHVFHAGCLERWIVEFKRMTCPLCRGTLAPPRSSGGGEAEMGVEVLFFKFCSFSNTTFDDDEGDSWWLR